MTRLELDSKLREILGNDHVYYQPPTGMLLKYPCCVYKLNTSKQSYADNKVYKDDEQFTVTFMNFDPDESYKTQMFSMFEKIRYDRRMVSDNLYHNVFILYI